MKQTILQGASAFPASPVSVGCITHVHGTKFSAVAGGISPVPLKMTGLEKVLALLRENTCRLLAYKLRETQS